MSIRLSDIGKQANEIEDEIGLNIDDVLNKLTQELGEFNDAIQKYRGRYCREKSKNLEDAKSEVGDLLFNIISICSRIGIDPDELPEIANNNLAKFKKRKQLYIDSFSNL